MGLNTASETYGGQSEDMEYRTEVINSSSDQDYYSWVETTWQVGTGELREQFRSS